MEERWSPDGWDRKEGRAPRGYERQPPMTERVRKLVVIGHGAAGLAAALAAAEQARRSSASIDISLIEKAPEDEAGGNTRWSPSYMQMEAPDRLAANFENDIREASGGRADPRYFGTLAENAAPTIAWLQAHGIEFAIPAYYLSATSLRIQPVGGGKVFVERLGEAARQAGVGISYNCSVTRLVRSGDRMSGVLIRGSDGTSRVIDADAVILATGGFQGNSDMLRQHFGPRAASMKLISPGSRFDTGDGIFLASELGATLSGDWNGMHAEPVDPRSKSSAPVVLVYPYGIVVDQNGFRFFDEGRGLVHETWEAFARDIQTSRPNSRVHAILDSSLLSIEGFERAIRSDVPPHRAQTLDGLAHLINVPSDSLKRTIALYNAAAGDAARFDPGRRDGLRTADWLVPPKSNWARPIVHPPYFAYPVVGAIAYTFGGLATNDRAEVLGESGAIAGLYAAGEVTGHFYRMAPNAVAMLRALVYGRIAGQQAVNFLTR
jgi:tricarballylate dehydrogenase